MPKPACTGHDFAAQLEQHALIAAAYRRAAGCHELGRYRFSLLFTAGRCGRSVADLEADKARDGDVLAQLGDLGLDHLARP